MRRLALGSVRAALGVVALVVGLASAAEPQTLITGDVAAGRRRAQACVPCHGPDGNSTKPAMPSLAGQPALYTYYQLYQYREGRRVDPDMSPFAANLTDADMRDIAVYYAAQAPLAPRGAGDPAKIAAGRRLVVLHHCNSCHAPDLMGQKHIPRLAGQPYEHLLKQLRAFKAQTRADMDGGFMMGAAQPLSEEEIETLAHYVAHLSPTR